MSGVVALRAGGQGTSRLGGTPVLPAGEAWPEAPDGRRLAFVAALDLAALPHPEPLPDAGVLVVFWDLEIHELERMDFVAATRVFHTSDPEEQGEPAFGPVLLAGEAGVEPTEHQLLGTSRDIQGPVLEEVAMWLEGGFPASRERYDAAELRGEGWTLLAQFQSVEGLSFGDEGALYLVIPAADLKAARFDRVMGIMQC